MGASISGATGAALATTLFGIDPVPLIEEATRLEFAGGVSAKLGPGVSLFAQAGYQFAARSDLHPQRHSRRHRSSLRLVKPVRSSRS